MNKIKLNTGLASIMIVASIFAGWQTLLLVVLLMFIFCEVEERVKDVAVKVITFYVGYYIVSLGWDVIVSAANLVSRSIISFVNTFNSYVDPVDYLVASKITSPINLVIDVASGVVSIMFVLVRIGFVISVLTGKTKSQNSLSKKIDEYVSKALNYVNGIVINTPVQTQNVAPVQQVQPQNVTPTVQQTVQPVQQPTQASVQSGVPTNNNINNQ